MNDITWHCKHFKDISAKEFHDLLQLRINVFVVEQNCPYPELDDKDVDAYHVFGIQNGQTIAVARLLKAGVSYKEWSIGRVATHIDFRKNGLGKLLMNVCLNEIDELAGKVSIRISGQQYLETFYNNLGFKTVSDMYLEDDIPHIEMLKD